MQTLDHDEVTIHIAAPPERLYDIIADVTRIPELSPEILRCEWLGGASSAAPGARFRATNKVSHRPSWKNRPVITVAERGREIAWSRTEPFGGTVMWRYRFEPEGSGARVTEAYEVTRPLTRIGAGHRSGWADRHTVDCRHVAVDSDGAAHAHRVGLLLDAYSDE
jgi:hypothetical protein